MKFHDYRPVFEAFRDLPNVGAFMKQTAIFKDLLEKAGPDKMQDMDPSWSLPLGEMFSIVVYGQLILEQAQIDKTDPRILNQIFDFMVRDFAHFALQIYGNHRTREEQREYFMNIMHIRAVPDEGQYDGVWKDYVSVLSGEYEMNP